MNKRNEIEIKKLDNSLEEKRWAANLAIRDKDIEYAKAEAAGRKDVAIVEGEATVEAARMGALAAAQAADKVTADELKAAGGWKWLLVLSSAVNKWVRPVATVVLTYYALNISLLLIQRLSGDWTTLPLDQKFGMSREAQLWVTAQASAALGYWFMARGSSK
jgi:hypothetical protein